MKPFEKISQDYLPYANTQYVQLPVSTYNSPGEKKNS
jgi:hypothetical protein